MIFPFESLATTSRELGLVVAVFIGFGFGFVLERAGFGRTMKLAGQFYFRDMTVFKVMFTAIVTAMLGLVAASSVGLADLRSVSESIASWTWIWPMLAGGLVLGVGFIISGYCPGTSLVSGASGNIDGMVTFAGVVAGTFVYSELLQIPAFARFHESGAKEAWFLYDIVPLPPMVIALAFAAMALVAFVGAEKVEKLVAAKAAVEKRTPAFAMMRGAAVTFATIALVAVVGLAIPSPTAAAPSAKPQSVAASELAKTIATEPWTIRIVDVRDAATFAKGTIPGAENVAAADLANIPDDGRRVVVVADGVDSLPPFFDRTTYAAWKSDPLAAQLSGARPAVAAAPARPAGTFVKPKKKGGGCSS